MCKQKKKAVKGGCTAVVTSIYQIVTDWLSEGEKNKLNQFFFSCSMIGGKGKDIKSFCYFLPMDWRVLHLLKIF